MEHTDKFDNSKFKFEYLEDGNIGRFSITDKDGNTNIFDLTKPKLKELSLEIFDLVGYFK